MCGNTDLNGCAAIHGADSKSIQPIAGSNSSKKLSSSASTISKELQVCIGGSHSLGKLDSEDEFSFREADRSEECYFRPDSKVSLEDLRDLDPFNLAIDKVTRLEPPQFD